MQIKHVMTGTPLSAGPDSSPDDLQRLMDSAQVHHIPVVDDGRLVGLWVATPQGPLALVGPERVHETGPEADADSALQALLEGQEAVVVWDAGRPVGLLTRSDVLRLARAALRAGLGRRHRRPLVVRLIGPAGAGKSTILMRTLPILGNCEAAMLQANPAAVSDPSPPVEAVRIIDAPEAHWRKGLGDWVRRLEEVQLLLVEDRDGPPVLSRGLGGDLEVIVVPAGDLAALGAASLAEAQAVIVTMMDRDAGGDGRAAAKRLRETSPRLEVFAIGPADDDAELLRWRDWIEGQVLRRQH